MVSFVPGYHFHRTGCCLGMRVGMENTEYGAKDNLVTRFVIYSMPGYILNRRIRISEVNNVTNFKVDIYIL